ncbi:MAG: RtcB family protein [Actinobacteria bacterium]|nr:RtcB family protein [Actinomycetota bacterium]MCL6087170.1 RtcB family protein [Actinomycetota bacterium]
MRVPGIIFSDKELLEHASKEETLTQVANVATLPGILKASYAMPDIHYGYGFPIGGVAGFDLDEGVISPGGVGFDIACGVRLLRSNLEYNDIKKNIEILMHNIFTSVPKGLGTKGRIKLNEKEILDVLKCGAVWAIKNGYGEEEDKYHIEENGCMEGANPLNVSREAIERGFNQVGSLGSGNHFIEVQKVEEIFDRTAAQRFGLYEEQVTVMIHSGSRGLGYQICSDYLKVMQKASVKYNINLPDRQLACAPVNSPESRKYYSAMVCAVNFAIANRQCLAHWIRTVFEKQFNKSYLKLGLDLIYDISHNIAKFEKHDIDGKQMEVCIHRKGATRSFGPNIAGVPDDYKDLGQPVIIPGDMGRYSYILLGTQKAMNESMGSTCHGAGRLLSRTSAKKQVNGKQLQKELLDTKGIVVLADSMSGLSEEAPVAYKDVRNIVDIAEKAGLSRKVAKLVPLGVIKG